MCGLIGVASTAGMDNWIKRRDAFTEGLITDSFRGEDSTGIAMIKRGHEKEIAEIYKKAVAGWDFIQLGKYQRYWTDFDQYSMVLGHNRSATRANVSDRNSHPFTIGNITLVHNGTINNEWELGVKDLVSTGVDSEAICACIHKYGEKEGLEKLKGGYSLVWHNAGDGSLNFARNDQRPMFWAYLQKENTMFWGSEMEMLWMLLRRNGLNMDGKFKLPLPMNHYKIFAEELRKVVRTPFALPKSSEESSRERVGMWPHWNKSGTQSTSIDNGVTKNLPVVIDGTTKTADTIVKPRDENPEIGSSVKKPDKSIDAVTNKDKVDKINGRLKKYDLLLGDRFLIHVKSFHPYKNSKVHGVIHGQCNRFKALDAEIHKMTVEQWKDFHYWGTVYVKAVNLRYTAGQEVVICEVSDARDSDYARRYNQPGRMQQHPRMGDQAANGNRVVDRLVPGPHGHHISAARFEEYAKNGCGSCNGNVNILRADQVGWVGDPPSPVCHECMADDKTRHLLGIPPAPDFDNVVPIDARSLLN